MPKIPLLRPAEVVKAFERLGWRVSRQRGSHVILTTLDTSQRFLFLRTRKSHAELCAL